MKTDAECKKEVVAHWGRLLAYAKAGDGTAIVNEGFGAEQCAFCDKYLDADAEICGSCPVKLATKKNLCNGSPYYYAAEQLACITSRVSDSWSAVAEQLAFLEGLEAEGGG